MNKSDPQTPPVAHPSRKSVLAFVLLAVVLFPTVYALGMLCAASVIPVLYIELYHPFLQDPKWQPSSAFWIYVIFVAGLSVLIALLGTVYLQYRARCSLRR
jgi:hypothetical protein